MTLALCSPLGLGLLKLTLCSIDDCLEVFLGFKFCIWLGPSEIFPVSCLYYAIVEWR